MERRDFFKKLTLGTAAALLLPRLGWAKSKDFPLNAAPAPFKSEGLGFTKNDFGANFKWGVATAAYQIEGAWNVDGKGESVWDRFTHNHPKKIKGRSNGDTACDFYNTYHDDLALVKAMNLGVYRFSIAWSRIMPNGYGAVNQKGVDFYHRVIDRCLELGVEPWITLYHWDLPQALEDKGGWVNRDIVTWFSHYTEFVTKTYGDKVKNWMVLNEPAAFTGLGYLIGKHAPGHVAPKKFLATVHHACMAMGEGGRIIRRNVPNAKIGTTFSCAPVKPVSNATRHVHAAERADILFNRLFIEPVLGMGYPTKNFAFVKGIEKHVQPGDMEKIQFDFDFIGVQNYTQTIAKHSAVTPFLWATEHKAKDRGVKAENITAMGWEVYPEGIYEIIRQFGGYPNVKEIIVTENGAAFPDVVEGERVHDQARIDFFKSYLEQVLRAKREGVNVTGYFVWTFLDNFEWAEGYDPRFGLVYTDYSTQKRIIKDSGLWFKEFLM